MKLLIIRISVLALVFILSTSIIVILLAEVIPAIFPDLDVQSQGPIFALGVILLYPTVGITSVYFANKLLNKRLGPQTQSVENMTKIKKVFELHQKITLMLNEYVVLKDAVGPEKKIAGYARQKRLALREHFNLFTDQTQSQVLAVSKARSVIDIAPTFDIYDANQKPLAVFKKEFTKSLLISTWSLYDAQMQKLLFTIHERSQSVAMLRRLWELVGEIPFPIKYHFVIKDDNKIVGEYVKITRLRDHYALYLEENHLDNMNERVWMVVAVLLDSMQSR